MQYDQSWMGLGWIGGFEAGAISALAGFVLYLLFHWIERKRGWSEGRKCGWAYFLALILTASGDLWNLFYFNYASGLEALQLLRAKLAEVHDPASLGTRVLCELIGAALGVYVAWLLCGGRGRHFRDHE